MKVLQLVMKVTKINKKVQSNQKYDLKILKLNLKI